MKKLITLLILTMAFTMSAAAVPILCDSGIANVLDLNGGVPDDQGCTFGGKTFDQFSVSTTSPGGAQIGILDAVLRAIPGGMSVDLIFSVITNPLVLIPDVDDPIDILFGYRVRGTELSGIDSAIGTHTGSVSIIENACAEEFAGVACGDLLASLAVSTPSLISNADEFSRLVDVFFVRKDIRIGLPIELNITSAPLIETHSLSDFENSHHMNMNQVPEPASLLLLGSGLIGLAFLRRRKKTS